MTPQTKVFCLSNHIIKDGSVYYLSIDSVKKYIQELKDWVDKEHVHFDGNKAIDCDKHCWGKTFPDFIDKLAGKELR